MKKLLLILLCLLLTSRGFKLDYPLENPLEIEDKISLNEIQTPYEIQSGSQVYFTTSSFNKEGKASTDGGKLYLVKANFASSKGGLTYKKTLDLRDKITLQLSINIPITIYRKIYGFAVVFSLYNNSFDSGDSNFLGYESARRAYAIQFTWNFSDISSSTTPDICFHDCSNYCSACTSLKSISSFGFELARGKEFNGNVKIIIDPSNLEFQVSVNGIYDTRNKFSRIYPDYLYLNPYLTLTGSAYWGNIILKTQESYIIHSQDPSFLPILKIYYNGTLSTNTVMEAGSKFGNYLKFPNYGFRLAYSTYFKISRWCNWVYTDHIVQFKNDRTEYIWYFQNCTETGTFTLYYLSYHYNQNSSVSFTFVAGPLNKVVYYGYENIKSPETCILSYGENIIRYGKKLNTKDFILSEFNNKKAHINFQATDQYGNPKDLGSNETKINDTLELIIKDKNGNPVVFNIQRNTQSNSDDEKVFYSFLFNISQYGDYYISSKYFLNGDFKMRIYDNVPSEDSFCTIVNEERDNLKQNTKVKFNCTLYDSYGEKINLEKYDNFDFTFIINLEHPDGNIEEMIWSEEDNSLVSTFTTLNAGHYKFTAYYTYNENTVEISSRLNEFNVLPEPEKISEGKLYSFSDKTWFDLSEEKILEFDYTEDDNKYIFGLDLIHTDGNYFSEIGWTNFNNLNLNGIITSEHEKENKTLSNLITSIEKIGDKEILIFKIKDTRDIIFRRSTFNYLLKLDYLPSSTGKKDELVIKIKFGPLKNGGLEACYHLISGSKTKFEGRKNSFFTITAGEEIDLGTLYLITQCGYLYNYDEPDLIKTYIEPSLSSDSYSININPNSNIYGAYNVKINILIKGTYKISFKVNDELTEISFSITVLPIKNAYYIIGEDFNPNYIKVDDNIYQYKYTYTADETPTVYFQAKDKYNNIITDIKSYSDIGISITLKKEDVLITDSQSIESTFDSSTQLITLTENIKKLGNFSLTVQTKDSLRTIKFIYSRNLGKVSLLTSSLNYISSQRVTHQSTIYVLIKILDAYSNNYNSDKESFNKAVDNIKVFATKFDSSESSPIYLEFCDEYEDSARFKISNINIPGNYYVKGTIYENEITNIISNTFTLVKSTIDIYASLLIMITDKIQNLNANTTYYIKIKQNVPIFKMKFYNSEGDEVSDNNLEIMTLGIQINDEITDLDQNIYKNNSIYYTIPNDLIKNLPGQKGKLTLSNELYKDIELVFLDDNDKDYDESSEIDITKTYYSNQNLTIIAGETEIILMEFRTEKNLRYAKEIDISKLNFTYSNQNEQQDINIKFNKGQKLGQIIIEIIQTKSNTFSTANLIKFSYNNEIIDKNIFIIVTPGEFDHFIIDTSYIEWGNQLFEGTVSSDYSVSFYPKDKYENTIVDMFNSELYNQEDFYRYFYVSHELNIPITVTSTTEQSTKIKIVFNTKIKGLITISSKFLDTEYYLNMTEGEISTESTGYIAGNNKIKLGESFSFIVIPRDKCGNKITYEISQEDLQKINVEILSDEITVSLNESIYEDNLIKFNNIKLEEEGTYTIKAYYNEKLIDLSNNFVIVGESETIKYCNFVDEDDNKISESDLPKAKADEIYTLRALCYDTNNEKVTTFDSLDIFNITHNGEYKNQKIEISTLKLNGGIKLRINPIYMGEYSINSIYFENEYKFTSEPGDLSFKNSIIEVSKNLNAGNDLNVYVYLFDSYGNSIKAIEDYKNKFKIIYQYPLGEDDFKQYSQFIDITYSSIDQSLNAIVYKINLIYEGLNVFYGLSINSKILLKCKNCYTTVNPGNYGSLSLYQFDFVTNKFKQMSDENSDENIESNCENNLILRLYPTDDYGNIIKKSSSLITIQSATISEINMKTTIEEDFIELTAYSNETKILEGGEKEIKIICEDGKTVTKNILLYGDLTKEFYTSQTLNVTKTRIIDKNLDFEAGDIGSMQLELRTVNNIKYYSGTVENIVIKDCENKILNINKLSLNGTLFIILASTKSNSYPYYTKCPLTIYLNDEPITIQPKIKVSPCTLDNAKIIDEYIESGAQLKSITADDEFEFEIAGYDIYDNLARTTQSKIRASIKDSSSNSYDFTSNTNILYGYQYYYTSLTLAGTYYISAGTNSKEKNLFNNDEGYYKINIKPGKFNAESSDILLISNEISAGEMTNLTITPKDKNYNIIPVNEISELFKVTLNKDTSVQIPQYQENDNTIEYFISIEIKGEYSWKIYYNETDEVTCYDCNVNVIADIIELKKTILYANDENGEEKQYNINDTLYSNVNKEFDFSLSFRDKYNNDVDKIDKDKIILNDINLYGNDMENKINFIENLNSEENRYLISINKNDSSLSIYNTIVTYDKYLLTFTLSNTKETLDFTYYVNHKGKYSSPYCNGIYDVAKSKLDINEISIKTGETFNIILYLLTSKGCNYTGKIDLDDITYDCNILDLNVEKSETEERGKYNILIWYNKVANGIITIFLKDPITKNMQSIGSINIKISINDPYPEYTNHTEIDDIYNQENAKINIYLKDQYENEYTIDDYKSIEKYLSVITNDKKTSQFNFDFSNGYIALQFYPSILLSRSKVNIIYKKGTKEIYLFPQDVYFNMIVSINWDYTKFKYYNLYEMTAGDYLSIELKLYDIRNSCYNGPDVDKFKIYASVKGPLGEQSQKEYKYQFKYYQDNSSDCIHGYKLYKPEKESDLYTKKGSYTIQFYVDEKPQIILQTSSQTVIAGDISSSNFVIKSENDGTEPLTIKSNDNLKFTMYAYDKYNNSITSKSILESSSIYVINKDGSELSTSSYTYTKDEIELGQITFSLTIYLLGNNYNLQFKYNDQNIIPRSISSDLKDINVIPGSCSNLYPEIELSQFENGLTGIPINITIQCRDYQDNQISEGGEDFSQSYIVASYIYKKEESEDEEIISVDITSKLYDLNNGKYVISFTPPFDGNYSAYIRLGGDEYGNKSYNYEIKYSNCDSENPIQCTKDIHKCVKNILECIDIEERGSSIDYPFKCLVDGIEMEVSSRSECDCPENYTKCGIHNYCVPKDKEQSQCPFFNGINCEYYNKSWYLQEDGICRESISQLPSQRVCPYGSVLCSDLSCRSNYDECQIYESCDEITCQEHTCTNEQGDCPSSITCEDTSNYVCPDGECVTNEIYCKRLPVCPPETPFLCASSNICASSAENCPTPISCGHGYSLCSDNICRFFCS